MRILKSLFLISAVVAVAGGATYAYFSDTETSEGNTVTAGTLDLKVDGKDDPQVVHITRANIRPGAPWSTQYGGQWVIKNTGSVPGTVTATIKNVVDSENGCIEPEAEAGDASCGASDGELSGLLGHVVWSINEAPWGRTLSPSFSSLKAADGIPVTGTHFHLNPGQQAPAYLNLSWDASTNDNRAQGDEVSFDIEFTLNQDH